MVQKFMRLFFKFTWCIKPRFLPIQNTCHCGKKTATHVSIFFNVGGFSRCFMCAQSFNGYVFWLSLSLSRWNLEVYHVVLAKMSVFLCVLISFTCSASLPFLSFHFLSFVPFWTAAITTNSHTHRDYERTSVDIKWNATLLYVLESKTPMHKICKLNRKVHLFIDANTVYDKISAYKVFSYHTHGVRAKKAPTPFVYSFTTELKELYTRTHWA